MYIVVEKGHSIRFIASFKDYEKNPIDPTYLEFKVYDRHETLISTTTLDKELYKAFDENQNPITGSFFYDYTPQETGTFYIEFSGMIKNNPSLKRKKIRVVFNT